MESRDKTFDEVGTSAVQEFCNIVRRCHGAVEIEDLIAGVPGNEKLCLVARSVNCGLGVHPASQVHKDDVRAGELIGGTVNTNFRTVWSLVGGPEHEELLRRVAVETESRMIEVRQGHLGTWAVPVPRYVAECAEAFDNEEIDQFYYLGADDPVHPDHDEWLEEQEHESTESDESEEVPF